MVWATGDTHGSFTRFEEQYFPEQREMDRDDYVIICGDFGGVWSGGQEDAEKLDWLEDRPFTTLFVDGNHENFDLLNALLVQEWHGGKVHCIRPHVLHLMRGQFFDIGGRTFFTMGGAASHDIQDGILDPADPGFRETYWSMRRLRRRFRVKGLSWWPEEMPTDEEYTAALEVLERASWKVDYVITHCAPTRIAQKVSTGYRPDVLTDFLEMVRRRLDFRYWLFGHYHDNRYVTREHILLWEQIVQVI